MQEIAKASLRARGYVAVRGAAAGNVTGSASDVALNANGTINMTAWDAQASQACKAALSNLAEASNPSGTSVCYNLPALDNTTGTFEADLRLYQLSAPSGQFSGIPPQDIQVALSYSGASVSPVNSSTASQEAAASAVARRQNMPRSDGSNVKLLQRYLFVGQIDKAQMTGQMTT